jgi:DNA-directed RNA polymerase specialized sigma24 family protein
MSEDFLVEQFTAQRQRLHALAYRMLGSSAAADDAVQEAWLRFGRNDEAAIENVAGWLTTVTARICLNVLRSRGSRREEPLDAHVPDPVVERLDGGSAAAREGDLDRLVAVLDPDVVARSDGGTTRPLASAVVRGAANVARRAALYADPAATLVPALVNGAAGAVAFRGDEPVAVLGFTIVAGRITAMDALADTDRLRVLELGTLLPP